jgi:hypothetical protein
VTDQHRPETPKYRLRNGAAPHVLTLEDRRKAAAVTNEIRREKRAWFEAKKDLAEYEAWLARREERLRRKRIQQRERDRKRRASPVCETDARPRNGAVTGRLLAAVLPERAAIRTES